MQQPSVPTPPPPPSITPGTQIRTNLTQSPAAIYQGYLAQRSELRDQLETLQEARHELASQLTQSTGGADRTGIEQHLTEIDARITTLNKQIAVADAQVAQAAVVPGAVVREPPYHQSGPPDGFYALSGLFVVVVLFPLTIAYARRLWRRGSAAVATLPQELMDRLTRLDQAVDSVAVEVERIGEGQRFVTRVFAERPVEPIGIAARGAEPLREKGEGAGT